jgi:hypothetical protein
MDRLEFGRGEHRPGIAFVAADLIVELELFQQP